METQMLKSDNRTSTSQLIVDLIDLSDIREEWKNEAKRVCSYRIKIPANLLSFEQFTQYIQALGSVAMMRQSDKSGFKIDSVNAQIIEELYKYTVYDKSCSWNLDKGLMFWGQAGTGKSVLLFAYSQFLQRFADSPIGQSMGAKVFKFSTAQDIANEIIENKGKLPLRLINSGLAADEIGREVKEINSFGNKITPIIDLIFTRYAKGLITHGTSNFSLNTLSEADMYGSVIGDRLKAMFNFIGMPGNSRRK